MNVRQLQSFLSSLSQPLSESGAKKVAEDLQQTSAALDPFRDWNLSQFADFLVAADHYAKTGEVPRSGRARSAPLAPKAGDPEAVNAAIAQVLAFYDRVAGPEITYASVEAEVKRLEKQFKKDELLQIAKGLGISGKPRTKKDAAAEIQNWLNQRKETFERTRF